MEFWRFVHPVEAGPELIGSHDPLLVVLSVTIACLAAYVALGSVQRMVDAGRGRVGTVWWALGAFSLGAGVWAMHFTGMMAFRLPMVVSYGLMPTLASAVPAVAGSAVAVWVLSRERRTPLLIQVAALCLAVGIGAMHFAGMEAMRMGGAMHYEPVLFAAAILVAYLMALAAMYANTLDATAPAISFVRRMGAPALMGFAVSGMHHTAMAAASFHTGDAGGGPAATVPTGLLGIAIALFALFLLSAMLLFMYLDAHLARSRETVRDRVSRLQVVLDTMPDGLITVDANGDVETMNRAAARMFGLVDSAAKGRPITEFLSTVPCGPGCGGEGAGVTHRARGQRADGSTFQADVKTAATGAGRSSLTTVVVRDVTDRRAAEEELLRLATVVDQSSEAIAITDADGHVTYVNPAFVQMSGYDFDEARGQVPDVLQAGMTTEEFHQRLWRSLRAGQVWRGSSVNRRKDGTRYATEASITPLRDETGSITSFIEVRRDVSEQQELSRQLARAQKLESIGQLASGIAHEINTPTQYVSDNIRFLKDAFTEIRRMLDAISAGIGTASSSATPPAILDDMSALAREIDLDYLMAEMPGALDQALDGVERIATIVSAMKVFSHQSTEKAPADLNALIRSTVTVTKHEWKYVAEVVLELDADLPLVPCRAAEVNQAILNLVVNAAHAISGRTTDGAAGMGRITIRTRRIDDIAEITIDDTGIGIPESIRGRIFDPFFTTKEVGAGTGQGLTIVHQIIVQTHGGSIAVDSDPEKGTRFTIQLPLHCAATDRISVGFGFDEAAEHAEHALAVNEASAA
jgi:PAS domain S-box-containing protein